MVVGVRIFDLHIPGSRSLKEKRFVIKSLRDKIRTRFNVSVAEIDYQDLWQRSAIAVAAVNQHKPYIDGLLEEVYKVFELERRIVLLDITTEYY